MEVGVGVELVSGGLQKDAFPGIGEGGSLLEQDSGQMRRMFCIELKKPIITCVVYCYIQNNSGPTLNLMELHSRLICFN